MRKFSKLTEGDLKSIDAYLAYYLDLANVPLSSSTGYHIEDIEKVFSFEISRWEISALRTIYDQKDNVKLKDFFDYLDTKYKIQM